ncbi:MAG: cytochrome b N-terminal domain-containing protein [Verrucomicrobia bacterium]|nr:cytochrome b N-terminal domain-containing protein [Verrucomicrobiota bacterium]
MNKLIHAARGVFLWVDDRLHLTKLYESTAGHHVPQSSGSWFYVFGSATLLCFMIQIATGILLAMVYVPSAAEAYTTLEYLTFHQYLGWFLRGVHYWGSNFMVGIMLLHMTQVFLFGAYKYPREITWITGVVLMVLTLGLAFTGQVMRFDEDAYWGLGIGVAIMGRVPLLGEQLVNMMLGGPIIASDTLSRFFALHVFVLPGGILALVSIHLRMVLTKGINEYPQPGMLVRRESYDKEYAAIIKKEGVPFFPKAISKDLVAAAVVIIGILACATFFGPKGPLGPPNPLQIDTLPRPDFYFLWIFAIAALMPDWMESVALLGGPVIIGIILFALPFFNGTGEKSWRRRPIAVLTVILTYVSLGLLTYLGHTSPWSPDMNAWRSAHTPKKFLEGRSPLELQGSLVIQSMQCRNCHAIDGIGGQRGPDLADVGARLTKDQLVRQVIQGGGNMPAYGKNLTPDQVDAVVAYMVSLRTPGVAAARDSSQPGRPPME